jgi:hypothetical protein
MIKRIQNDRNYLYPIQQSISPKIFHKFIMVYLLYVKTHLI